MSEPGADTIRLLFERLGRGGLEPALDLISEDFVVEIPSSMSAEPDVYRGHDGARRYFAGFDGLMEEVRFEALEIVEHDDALIVWLRLSGRGAASGIEVDQHAAAVTWLEGGKVKRIELYTDMDDARAALAT